MEWNVICNNINKRKIELFNIFDHAGFRKESCSLVKKYQDKAPFAEELRHSLKHYFWCKCEWEVLVFPWPCFPEEDNPRKIDVFWQIDANWAAFLDYAWEHRQEIKPER